MNFIDRIAKYPNTFRSDQDRRLNRVLAIVILLINNPDFYRRRDLAEYFGVTERMITKDIAMINRQLRVIHSKKGYSIRDWPPGLKEFEMPKPESILG